MRSGSAEVDLAFQTIASLLDGLTPIERQETLDLIRLRYFRRKLRQPVLPGWEGIWFGPIEQELLLILKRSETALVSEDKVLCLLWGDAVHILNKGTAQERRRLQQRLAVRISKLNDKFLIRGLNLRIIRKRLVDKIAYLHLKETR
jgi:hypothetical protein